MTKKPVVKKHKHKWRYGKIETHTATGYMFENGYKAWRTVDRFCEDCFVYENIGLKKE